MSLWGISSAGRAPALHAGGQEFDPPTLHHLVNEALKKAFFLFSVHIYTLFFYRPFFLNV